MSLKIEVPETSQAFKLWLYSYIHDTKSRFWEILNFVSGEAQSVEMSVGFEGIGGCIGIDSLLAKSECKPLISELIIFNDLGYSGGDFQHILLAAYLDVAMESALNGHPLNNKLL